MGHTPPYLAVINLALMTAHHWRAIRLKLALAGISNPMTAFGSMHALLDVTEATMLEWIMGDNPEETSTKRERFIDDLYRPRPQKGPDGKKRIIAPAGFTTDTDLNAFEREFGAG